MPKTIELTVPDLGGFEDVPIIEVLVAPGDTIGIDAPLVTLESDKATMEVPAASAGIVRDVKVKLGDRVSQGTVLAALEVADDAPVAAGAPASAAAMTAGAVTDSAPVGHAAPAASTAPQPTTSSAQPAASTGEAAYSAVTELRVPDIGDFRDVPVITVFVRPGDVVAVDAPLVELESEKATMEVPATAAGTVSDVFVKVGDRVSQGSLVALVSGAPGSVGTAPPPAAPAPATPAPPAAAAASNAALPVPAVNGAHGVNGKGNGTSAHVAAEASPVPAAAAAAAPAATNGTHPVHASPAIRRFARELGVPLGRVSGSGPNGRITREDVQAYVKVELSRPPAPPPSAAAGGGLQLMPWPKVDFAKFGPVDRTPLSRIAKISGPALARNWAMIPHVTQNEEADVTELEAFRKQVNAEQSAIKVTMLALLIKAVVASLRAHPAFNSSLDGDELVLKRYYNIGFAADTPAGLVVPVIKDADSKGVLAIAAETSALAKKARDGKLGPNDMSGSTFTISSLGGIGGTTFTPIINAPEVAILGASRSSVKPVWDGTAFVPRTIMPLSLSYDHRVIDGAAAARFVVHLAGALADLRKVLL